MTIYALNRPEWVITDIACHAYSLTVVALYDTLGEEASEFILNQTQSPIVVASIDHVPHLIQMKDKLPSLKIIVSMDDLNEGDLKGRSKGDLLGVWAKEKGVDLLSFREGMILRRAFLISSRGPRNRDAATTNPSNPRDYYYNQLYLWNNRYAKGCCPNPCKCRCCSRWT